MDLLGGNMASALELDPVSTKQQQIAELAKQSPHMGFTSLAHHIDLHWLYEAYVRTRKNGAPGVDGQTAADFNKGTTKGTAYFIGYIPSSACFFGLPRGLK